MYYKKYDTIPKLSYDLKLACIELAENNLKIKVPLDQWFSRLETTDKTSIAYIELEEDLTKFSNNAGGVGFYGLPADLNKQICDFYNDINNPNIKFNQYFIQVVTGGNFVAPHTDGEDYRSAGFLYLLKSGGTNVRTRWYEIKEEYKNNNLTPYAMIPYSRLNLIEDHILEEDCWHWLNFSKIHSVENQENLRIALWGTTVTR